MAKWFELEDLPIRVTAHGTWLHGDTPLHPKVAVLFAKHVVPQADGSFLLQLGMAKAPLQVEDTPYFVRSLQVQAAAAGIERVQVVLSDGQTETMDPATVSFNDAGVMYCQVLRHGRRVRVRFMPGQTNSLGEFLQQDAQGVFWVVNNQRYSVG